MAVAAAGAEAGVRAGAGAAAAEAAAGASSPPRVRTALPPGEAATPSNSAATVSAAVASALGGPGPAEPSLDSLLLPGGTTLRFTGPTLGYAEAAAISPPNSGSPPSGLTASSSRAPRLPHSRDDSISSEIEPAERPPAAIAGDTGARRPSQSAGVGSAAVHEQLTALRARLVSVEAELADSERTHALRDKATAVLKEEIAEMRRSQKRGAVDVTYIKAVLLRAFESGELPANSTMLPVLARLLEFSPAEVERLRKKAAAAQGSTAAAFPFKLPGF